MFLWLLKLVNPIKAIASEISKVKLAQQNADTEAKRLETEVHLEVLESKKQVLLAEQDNFLTRSVRPLWAAPFVIYTWKIVVWDKVFGFGVTDPLDEKMWALSMLIAGNYFFFRGSDKLIKTWRNK